MSTDRRSCPQSSPARRCPCCGRVSLHVVVPSISELLRPSPGFAKKGLANYKLDLLALCGFGCAYCSSNNGNYLRTRRKEFLALTKEQLGCEILPAHEPRLTFLWPDAIEKLERQLAGKPESWGEGKTVVVSMLTDAFSPDLVRNGTTERALKLLLGRTRFRIRILTKNMVVGRRPWIDLFARHRDRFVVGLSIGTLDDAWARRVEVGTSSPSARLRSHRRLQDAGVPTYGMLCPIFPDVVLNGEVSRLVAEIRPELCETVWAEPFNDRDNWVRVQSTYRAGSATHAWFSAAFGTRHSDVWSRYVIDLYRSLRTVAERDGWLSKLTYLLYEADLAAEHAPGLVDLAGVSLQSDPGPDGLSKNEGVARMQRATIGERQHDGGTRDKVAQVRGAMRGTAR